MTDYKLELKQIVDYPKCRIYRQFIQSLISDRSIRTNGCSGLFHYAVLCCYANFRTSYQRYDGISYIVHPGQWICPLRELRTWFRVRTNRQLLRHLDSLQRHHFIEYDLLGRGQLVQYSILDWPRYNTVLDYSCPCQKDSGFFFLPMSAASRLLSLGKCSEMDALLDLWLNAIYNDHQVAGSEAGPVVYLRNGTGSPLVSYAELGKRWGVSKATAGRILSKFARLEYIKTFSFPGRGGTAIYLQNYLSTMFQISDVMVDKEEVAMALNLCIRVQDCAQDMAQPDCASDCSISVSKSHTEILIAEVLKLLKTQGVCCTTCPRFQHRLYPLSDCAGVLWEHETEDLRLGLMLSCGSTQTRYFELTIQQKGANGNGEA